MTFALAVRDGKISRGIGGRGAGNRGGRQNEAGFPAGHWQGGDPSGLGREEPQTASARSEAERAKRA